MSNRYDTYLGDGVYASFDGFSVVLDLRAQDSTTRISLEPTVLRALAEYVDRVAAIAGQAKKDAE